MSEALGWIDQVFLILARVLGGVALALLLVLALSEIIARIATHWRGWKVVFEFARNREAFAKWKNERGVR